MQTALLKENRYFSTWTLFSIVFVSKWRIETVLEIGPVLRACCSETGCSVTSEGRCARQFTSIPRACFCHWQAQIVIMSVWKPYRKDPTEKWNVFHSFRLIQSVVCSSLAKEKVLKSCGLCHIVKISSNLAARKLYISLFCCFTIKVFTTQNNKGLFLWRIYRKLNVFITELVELY